MKTKILITRSLLQQDKDYLTTGLHKQVGDSFEFIEPKEYNEESLCDVAEDADVFLGPFVSQKLLDSAKRLKFIQVPWTGLDTFNFRVMKDSTIPVCNSHSNAAVVAELGITIILDLLKKVSYHDRKMRLGNWNRDQKPLNLKSKMLSQQKVCIIGYGNIGKRLGNYIRAFNSEVMPIEQTIDKVSLYSTVCSADVVVLTVPLTNETKNLVNDAFINHMKDGSFLVTLSRAGIVDEDAVYNALINGKLAGYGSDVWWNSPKRGESHARVSKKYDFEKLDQVVLSPHRAGYSENSLPHLDDVIINLANFIQGKPLINVVDIDKGF